MADSIEPLATHFESFATARAQIDLQALRAPPVNFVVCLDIYHIGTGGNFDAEASCKRLLVLVRMIKGACAEDPAVGGNDTPCVGVMIPTCVVVAQGHIDRPASTAGMAKARMHNFHVVGEHGARRRRKRSQHQRGHNDRWNLDHSHLRMNFSLKTGRSPLGIRRSFRSGGQLTGFHLPARA